MRVAAVTAKTVGDFERLFSQKGSPHFCWCAMYRIRGARALTDTERRDAMVGLVRAKTPIGVLAYEGKAPVGWCSIAPRESYARLEHSRTLPRLSEARTWTVLCFFVARPARRRGVVHALLEGGVKVARAAGAEEIEGWPFDTAGITSRHRGHSSAFRAAGFVRDGKRWVLR